MAWFFAPYKRRDPRPGSPGRYCAMDDFTAQIIADGADPANPWAEIECLGNYAVVKVPSTTSAATLNAINAAPGFQRVPLARLDDPLSTLTAAQRNQVQNFIVNTLGYPLSELQADLGTDLSTHTLRDVIRFTLKRKLLPRYNQPTDTIVLDGPQVTPAPVETIDAQIS